MARNISIIVLGIILLSCAQVGRLNGGEKDRAAPKIVEEKSSRNKMLHYAGESLSFEFDEYFTLINPSQTISLVPNHADLTINTHGKKLTIDVKGELREQTTYAVQFNRAIRDITEKNDSIFQFVFSTGDYLDSLTYFGAAVDALTGKAIEGATVVLTDSVNSDLKRVSSTNSNGEFTFEFLPKGTYSLEAFIDENLDGEHQSGENVAFPEKMFNHLDTSVIEKKPLRLFSPVSSKALSVYLLSDFLVAVHSENRLNKDSKVEINDQLVNMNNMLFLAHDSLLILLEDTISKGVLSISTSSGVDSTSFSFRPKFNSFVDILYLKTPLVLPHDTLRFLYSDQRPTYLSTEFNFISSQDTISLAPLSSNSNLILFDSDALPPNNYIVEFKSGEFKSEHGENKGVKFNISIADTSKLSEIEVTVTDHENAIIVQLMKQNEVIREHKIGLGQLVFTMNNIEPGEYTFRIINDSNNNGKWDTGNYALKAQPENVFFFPKILKLRSGWSSSVELNLEVNE